MDFNIMGEKIFKLLKGVYKLIFLKNVVKELIKII